MAKKGARNLRRCFDRQVECSESLDSFHQQAGEEEEAVCAVQSRTQNAASGESSKGCCGGKTERGIARAFWE